MLNKFHFCSKIRNLTNLDAWKDLGENISTMLRKHLRQFWKFYATLEKYKVWIFFFISAQNFWALLENSWCLKSFDILGTEESFHSLHSEKNPKAWKKFGQFWEFLCYPITMGKLLKLKKKNCLCPPNQVLKLTSFSS